MQNILDPDQKVKFQGFQLVVEPSGTRWNQGLNSTSNDFLTQFDTPSGSKNMLKSLLKFNRIHPQGNGMSVNGGGGVGTFHLQPGDSMTKFMHRCPNAIEAASSIPKEKIEVKGR